MVLVAIKVLDHLRYVLAPSRWYMMRAMLGARQSANSETAPPEPAPAARPA
jgi:hypothetical protein